MFVENIMLILDVELILNFFFFPPRPFYSSSEERYEYYCKNASTVSDKLFGYQTGIDISEIAMHKFL